MQANMCQHNVHLQETTLPYNFLKLQTDD